MTLAEAEKAEDKTQAQTGALTPLTHGIIEEGQIKPYTSLCYKLKSDDDFENVQRLAQMEFYKLSLVNQPISFVESYLLLTPPMTSMRESFKLEQRLKLQGYSDLWLFRSGGFRGRISLGLFGIKENATQAQKAISKKIELALEVTPRMETKQNLVVHIQLINSEINKFEEKFAKYIDKNSICTPEAVANVGGYNAIQY